MSCATWWPRCRIARDFEVQLVINAAIVGNGLYHKQDDAISVLREYGACQGLPL